MFTKAGGRKIIFDKANGRKIMFDKQAGGRWEEL